MIKEKKMKITEKDYMTFKLWAFLHDYVSVLSIVWTCALSVVVLIDFVLTRRSLLIAALAVAMPAIYIKNIFFQLPKNSKAEYESGAFPNPEACISLTENSLTILRENSSPSEIKLNQLFSSFESAKQFYFFISQHNYIILPKNILTKEEISEISRTIKALPRKNRKNPFSMSFGKALRSVLSLLFITLCVIMVLVAYKIT